MTAHERRVQLLGLHVRSRICTFCAWRTPATRHVSTDASLPCVAECSIFRHLGLLAEYADRLDPTVSAYDRVISALAVDCCGRGRSGCHEFATRECPMIRYGKELAALMRDISSDTSRPVAGQWGSGSSLRY